MYNRHAMAERTLDPTKMTDWQLAEEAEKHMKTSYRLAEEWGLRGEEIIPYGHYIAKVDFKNVLERLEAKPNGKYIDITAITPTPLGEGKSTTTMGLVEGLGKRGKLVSGAIRQPSSGPTFNIKGSAAGGGLAQCIPLAPLSLGLTGDIDCVTNANNLAMAALTARLQHEFNHSDEFLAKRNLKRLDIDPRRVEMKWAIDFCAQALRHITIGLGKKDDGFLMESGFAISVSSEIMAILAICSSLKDLRERMAKIIIAYDKQGNPVTTGDLEVDGAMTAWMARASNPNLLQTVEGQPVLMHAGPFANIAIGQSSIIADKLALKLSEFHVTESGFGADIGFEKFWNIKCRLSGLTPNCAVIVTSIRALKMHGGGPGVIPGKPLDKSYNKENLPLVEKGSENLIAHIETVKKSGVSPVVCINRFTTDTPDEIALTRRIAEEVGARVSVSEHWLRGGEGALELADAVIDACNDKPNFKFIYDNTMPLRQRIETIAREIYGASGVSYSPEAMAKIEKIEGDPALDNLATCMAKTQFSLSHDPTLKGRPEGWILPVTDVLLYNGAGLVVPLAGDIKFMPGMSSDPAFRHIDVDVENGMVKGLF